MQWCHWKHRQHHTTPLLMEMVLHDQKCHATSNFNHLDLKNTVVLFMMPLVSHDMKVSASGVKWHKRSYKAPFWSFWPKECIGAIDDDICVTWCWCQWHHMIKKAMLHLISISLTAGMQWCHWQHYWDDTNADAYGFLWPKSHVALHFDHLDLRNAMLQLMMLSTSHDDDNNA